MEKLGPAFGDATRRMWVEALRNVGLVVKVSEIPQYVEYAALRDRLAAMHPARRWLSFRLRKEFRRQQLLAQQALVAAVLEKATFG